MELWIARDGNGSIFLHSEKPQLNDTYSYWDSYESFKLDTNSFPEVTFEKWKECEVHYRNKLHPIRRSSSLNRKGGKKRTLIPNSFKLKTEKYWYCERCNKTTKKL